MAPIFFTEVDTSVALSDRLISEIHLRSPSTPCIFISSVLGIVRL